MTPEPDYSTLQTHHADCWRDSRHHACAVERMERLLAICDEQAAKIKNLERQLRAHEGYWTCAGCGIEFGPEVDWVSCVDEYLCVDCDIADEAERENPE